MLCLPSESALRNRIEPNQIYKSNARTHTRTQYTRRRDYRIDLERGTSIDTTTGMIFKLLSGVIGYQYSHGHWARLDDEVETVESGAPSECKPSEDEALLILTTPA